MTGMLEAFQETGRDLFLAGLITSHGGNLSMRIGDRILITRRGAMLGRLKEGDVVETALDGEDHNAALASRELIVHQAIYRQTGAGAVVHAHPSYAVVLSLQGGPIVPVDSEGAYLLGPIPVVAAHQTVGSPEVAQILPPHLLGSPVVMLKGHGSFAIGQTLEEALMWTSTLEAASRILYLARGM